MSEALWFDFRNARTTHSSSMGIQASSDGFLQGVMAEYAHLPTPIDALILALGSTGDARAVPAILREYQGDLRGLFARHTTAV
jgi:hypothetical protein